MRFAIVLLAVAATLGPSGNDAAVAQGEQFLFVTTREGQTLGVVQAGMASFKGLPYASPPIGSRRWRAPQPPPVRPEILTANQYGPACLQPPIPGEPARDPVSEDCLTVNVFRPFEVNTQLPVMVWIHGGSFVTGAGGDPLYDGSRLAQEGVIVVTFNYRLGPLGWFAHPALAQDGSDGAIANYGMMDQIAALHWVRDNIGAFGGDPNNVTLFGGSSVAMHMLCGESNGLFQKAIIQSGTGREPVRSLDQAEIAGKEFSRLVGAAGSISDLRATGPEMLLWAEKSLLERSSVSFYPIIDGRLVKQSIADGFRAGQENRVPLIIGTNDDDTDPFEAKFEQELKLPGDSNETLQNLYPEASGDPKEIARKLYTDRVFTEPARFLARAHAPNGSPTYRYRFSYLPEQQRPSIARGHGAELHFVFGTLGVPSGGLFTYRDRETSNILRAYWTNFAKNGDPNGAGLPLWDESSTDDKLLFVSNAGISSRIDPWARRLDRLEHQSERR
jgi:para-nitrobenzyl esterase